MTPKVTAGLRRLPMVAAALAALSTTSAMSAEVPRVLIPASSTWSLQAWSNSPDSLDGAKVVDVDIDGSNGNNWGSKNPRKDIQGLVQAGHIVLCYFSVGTLEDFRPDYNDSTKHHWQSVYANKMDSWDEWWLDLTKMDQVKALMAPRFQKAKDYGCHGVEPDNIDCWENGACWKYQGGHGYPTPSQGHHSQQEIKKLQAEFNQWQVDLAHSLGLAIAMKNNGDFIDTMASGYDCAVVEQAQQYDEGDMYKPFIDQNKAVFEIEYSGKYNDCTYGQKFHLQKKWCRGDSNQGVCSKSHPLHNCFAKDSPLPPTRCTSGTYSTSAGACVASETPVVV